MLKGVFSIKRLVLVIFWAVNLVACTVGNEKPAAVPVAIKLRWTHNAQFGGLYAADQEGYFAAEGIARPGGAVDADGVEMRRH